MSCGLGSCPLPLQATTLADERKIDSAQSYILNPLTGTVGMSIPEQKYTQVEAALIRYMH